MNSQRKKERERGKERVREQRVEKTREGGCCHVIEGQDKREKKQDNRRTNKPTCLSSPHYLWVR